MEGWRKQVSPCPSWLHPKEQSMSMPAPLPTLTETMMFAMVWLDILVSPNALMLKAPTFSVVATCSSRAVTSSDDASLEAAILCRGAGGAQPSCLGEGFGTDNRVDQGISTGHTGFTGRCLFSGEPPGCRDCTPLLHGATTYLFLLEGGQITHKAGAENSLANTLMSFHGDTEQSVPHSP